MTDKTSCVLMFVSAFFSLAAFVIGPRDASGQETIKPRMLMLVDTSGSMAWDIAGYRTNGDGSADLFDATGRACCPGAGGSRLYIAKVSMGKMVTATAPSPSAFCALTAPMKLAPEDIPTPMPSSLAFHQQPCSTSVAGERGRVSQ